jgi:hypothetical protein
MEKGGRLMERLAQAAGRFVIWAGLVNLATLLLSWTLLASMVLGLRASIVGLDVGPLLFSVWGYLWVIGCQPVHGERPPPFAFRMLVSTLWVARLGKLKIDLAGVIGLQTLLLER